MAQSGAAGALAFISEREIVVRVSVARRECDGTQISSDGLFGAIELVEDIAEIEESEDVAGIGFGCAAVELLGAPIPPQVEVDGSEVDVRGSVGGIVVKDLFVERDGAVLVSGFFSLDGSNKKIGCALSADGAVAAQRSRNRTGAGLLETVEIEEELAADGVDHGTLAAESQAGSVPNEAGLEQRIGHARDGLHGDDGMADGGGRDVVFAQSAEGAELAKILEGVGLLLRDESGFFPTEQLAGTDLQDSQDILTAIAGHSSMLPFVWPRTVSGIERR